MNWKMIRSTMEEYRNALRTSAALRKLLWFGIPTLILCGVFGGSLALLLAFGYLKTVWLYFAPRELVEARPVERAAQLALGLEKMGFLSMLTYGTAFWGVMMVACHLWNLYLIRCGETQNVEVSPLLLLSGSAFLLAGLVCCNGQPIVLVAFTAALAITVEQAAGRFAELTRQLHIRFHLA
ncbi:MAG: hypothetical protein PHY64_00550 [Eubacteriales bacterium]|nr:hypothetical protein [Eubacteriales bacterium]